MAENRFPRALLDNIGVLFEEGTDLLLGRDGLARKDPRVCSNEVMHFAPDGLDPEDVPKLERVAMFLRKLTQDQRQ